MFILNDVFDLFPRLNKQMSSVCDMVPRRLCDVRLCSLSSFSRENQWMQIFGFFDFLQFPQNYIVHL